MTVRAGVILDLQQVLVVKGTVHVLGVVVTFTAGVGLALNQRVVAIHTPGVVFLVSSVREKHCASTVVEVETAAGNRRVRLQVSVDRHRGSHQSKDDQWPVFRC